MADQPEDGQASGYVLEDQVGYLIRLAAQRHSTIFQTLAPFGLTPTQFSALVRLAQLGPCSQNELGRRAAMDVATIKGVVDRLRAKGLLVSGPDTQDKRRSVLSIAPEHRNIVDALFEAGHKISDATLKPLSAEERTTLTTLLKKISGQPPAQSAPGGKG